MEIAIIVVIVLLNLIAHELAHAWAMVSNGVRVEEIGLGIKLPKIPCLILRATGKRPTLVISPILIGAYVKPYNENDIARLPYTKKAEIFSAGVLANIIMGSSILIFYRLIYYVGGIRTVIISITLAIIITFLLIFRKQISVIMPVLGLAMLGLVVWSLFVFGLKDSLAGPAGIVQMAGVAKTTEEAIIFGAVFAFAIAATNMLPLLPLDGGKTMEALLHRLFGQKQWIKSVSAISIILFFLLIFAAFGADILRIFS